VAIVCDEIPSETTEDTELHRENTGLPRDTPYALWLNHSYRAGKLHRIRRIANYSRNLPRLTAVPRMTLVWVTKLFSSVPMKRPLAR
jgi:hypothetical protein